MSEVKYPVHLYTALACSGLRSKHTKASMQRDGLQLLLRYFSYALT